MYRPSYLGTCSVHVTTYIDLRSKRVFMKNVGITMYCMYYNSNSILFYFNMHCSWLVCCKPSTMYSSLDLGIVLYKVDLESNNI